MNPPIDFTSPESARRQAFESAALPHLDDLYRMASHTIGSRTVAEDLVQETYLQAWKSFDRFELGTNCRAWLFKILFHVIQHHRSKTFRWKFTDDLENTLEQTLVYEPPAAQHLTNDDVIAALSRVPENFREVVLLSDVYDFTYREIQETLGIPQGTVMSRLSRGRRLLRVQLANSASDLGSCNPQVLKVASPVLDRQPMRNIS